MQKKLLSGLFWILLANLLVKPLWILGIEVGVQNAVGNEVYGFYFSILSISLIFNILLDLGITNFNTRNIARHPQLIGKHLEGILGIKFLLVGLYMMVTFSVGLIMGYGSEEFHLLVLLTICQALNSLILYLRSNFEGLLLFKWDSLFSVLDRVLMILICGCMLWGPKFSVCNIDFTIYHFVYAQLVAYIITAALALIVIARKAHFRRLRWDWPFFLVIMRHSAPFALLVLLMASYNRIDPVLLRSMASDAEAGIYAGAFRLLDALTMVAYLVSVPLLPIFSRLCAQNNSASDNVAHSSLKEAIRLVFWPMMLFSIGAAIVGAAWASPLMGLLYPGRGEQYVAVFRVIVLGIIPIGLTYIFGTLLTAGGHLRQLNIFAAISLAINIIVNIILIPHLGAVGSAFASLTAQSFMAATQLILSIKLHHLPASAFRPPKLADLQHTINMVRDN